jgi:hypothetical protein
MNFSILHPLREPLGWIAIGFGVSSGVVCIFSLWLSWPVVHTSLTHDALIASLWRALSALLFGVLLFNKKI